jgi:hypothetical protein
VDTDVVREMIVSLRRRLFRGSLAVAAIIYAGALCLLAGTGSAGAAIIHGSPESRVASTSVPRLVALPVAGHHRFDRVVFQFEGGLPRVDLRYVSALIQDASGKKIPMPGRVILRVCMHQAVAHQDSGSGSVAAAITYALRNVINVQRAGDFGGVVRVCLIGGCARKGATFTIANEMIRTVTQFPAVKAVKIYDPAGKTTNRSGTSSSLPVCLQR